MKQSSDVTRAEETLETYQAQLSKLEQEFEAEVETATQKLQENSIELEPLVIRPRKTDIKPRLMALAWLPYWREKDGKTEPAWG